MWAQGCRGARGGQGGCSTKCPIASDKMSDEMSDKNPDKNPDKIPDKISDENLRQNSGPTESPTKSPTKMFFTAPNKIDFVASKSALARARKSAQSEGVVHFGRNKCVFLSYARLGLFVDAGTSDKTTIAKTSSPSIPTNIPSSPLSLRPPKRTRASHPRPLSLLPAPLSLSPRPPPFLAARRLRVSLLFPSASAPRTVLRNYIRITIEIVAPSCRRQSGTAFAQGPHWSSLLRMSSCLSVIDHASMWNRCQSF